MDKYTGKKLDGRYEIRELIGVGGMANVYHCYDTIDAREVAIKILKDEFLDNISAEVKLSEETLRQVFEMIVGNEGEFITLDDLKKLNSVYNEQELKELINKKIQTNSDEDLENSENKIDPEIKQLQDNLKSNYENQRQYSKEFLESLYANSDIFINKNNLPEG